VDSEIYREESTPVLIPSQKRLDLDDSGGDYPIPGDTGKLMWESVALHDLHDPVTDDTGLHVFPLFRRIRATLRVGSACVRIIFSCSSGCLTANAIRFSLTSILSGWSMDSQSMPRRYDPSGLFHVLKNDHSAAFPHPSPLRHTWHDS